MVECGAAIVFIANELVSWPKEELAGWQNLLTVHRLLKLSNTRMEAAQAIVKMHDQACRDSFSLFPHDDCVQAVVDFDTAASKLMESPFVTSEWRERVSHWITMVRHCASGFGHWQVRAPRYQRLRIVENGRHFIVRIRSRSDSDEKAAL